MAKNIKDKDSFSNIDWKVGDEVTFLCGNARKKGMIVIVDAHGTFENPNIPSYDIYVEEENMLYKHVKNDVINLAYSNG